MDTGKSYLRKFEKKILWKLQRKVILEVLKVSLHVGLSNGIKKDQKFLYRKYCYSLVNMIISMLNIIFEMNFFIVPKSFS